MPDIFDQLDDQQTTDTGDIFDQIDIAPEHRSEAPTVVGDEIVPFGPRGTTTAPVRVPHGTIPVEEDKPLTMLQALPAGIAQTFAQVPKVVSTPFTHYAGTTLPKLIEDIPGVKKGKELVEKLPGGKAAVGVVEGVQEIGDSFASPLGLVTLGIGALPKAAQKIISMAFAADMARHLPEQTAQLKEAIDSGDQKEAAKAMTGLVGNTVFSGLAAKHGLPEMKPRATVQGKPGVQVREPAEEGAQIPEDLQPRLNIQIGMPEAQRALAEIPETTKQSEVTNAKGIREDSGQPAPTGQVVEGGEVDSGGNVQQTPPGQPEPVVTGTPQQIAPPPAGAPPAPVRPAEAVKPPEIPGMRFDKVVEFGGKRLWQFTVQDNGIAHNAAFSVPEGATPEVIQAKIEKLRTDRIQGVAENLGWTYEGVDPQGMTTPESEGMVPGLRFTDKRPGSPTEGTTVYVSRDATAEVIQKAISDKTAAIQAAKAKEVKPVETKKEETQGILKPEAGAATPAAPPQKLPKFKAAKMERPHDIIDEIRDSIGMIRNKKAMRPGNEGYYGEGYRSAQERVGPQLFSKEGAGPDTVLKALIDKGMMKSDATVDDLWDAIEGAHAARVKHFRGETPEAQADKFYEAVSKKLSQKTSQKLSVGELSVGDKFKLNEQEFEIVGIDPDTGEVTAKDGKNFGVQTIPDGADIAVDAGSHEPAKEVPFEPEAKPAAPAPKLGAGQKQGDLVTSTQTEDFALVGEKATDVERVQAEKAQSEQAAREAAELENKQQPELIGMGGAVPSEFAASAQTPTSIKNATVDRERASRGLPPAVQPLRRDFGTVWDEAMALIDRAPERQDELIDELRKSPRALTDLEDALLLHRQVDLQNEWGKATRDLAQHHADGNEAGVVESKQRLARLSDQLQDLYDIGKRVGTETGRGLNARKMMALEDFTLAKMELDKRAANGGKPLTPDQQAEVAKLNERIAATQKAYDDYVAKSEAKISELEARKVVEKIVREVAPVDPVIKRIVDRIGTTLHSARDAARERIKARGGRLAAGLDPTELADYTVIGASHLFDGALEFAKWSEKMVGEFTDSIKPHLEQIFKASNEHFDSVIDAAAGKKAPETKKRVKANNPKERIEQAKESIKQKVADNQNADVSYFVNKMVRAMAEDGATDLHAVVDQVHDFLKTLDPETTRRDAMDAISGYGKYKRLSRDQVSTQVRDWTGQLQQISKLLDMFQREPVKKTGPERRTPSDEERRWLRLVNEAKKRFGVVSSNPAAELKSALASLKTRLRNQISDYEEQIASRQKFVRERAPLPEDAESKALREQKDKLKSEFGQMFGRPELSDEQRVKMALSSLERQSAEIERQIKQGDIFPVKRTSKTPNTAELDAARAKRDALKEEREYLREAIQPTERMTPEERSLKALKSRLANRTAELQAKLAKGDFTTKPRRPVAMDEQARRLKVANERAKEEFRRGLVADRLKNRTPFEKTMDTLVKWRRAFILSGPVTLAKLTSAAVQRMTFTPAEEAIGFALSKAFPQIAKVAAREGGISTKAEAKALVEGFTKGMKDSWDVLKTGKSELDVLYGRDKGYPVEMINLFGHLHGALKTVTKRNEFARSLQKRTEAAIAQGIDVSDPMVQTRLAVEAYKDGNRSIFMQDNTVVSAYKRALSALDQPSKVTGRVPFARKAAVTTLRVLLPIVKIPTNIVAETFEYAGGSVTGTARLMRAFAKGAENLKPEEADLILRNLKKGSLGAAVMLLGFFNPNIVGGYYQEGEKRKKSDVRPGEVRVAGHDIPSYLLHNPLLETLQLGATIRRVADSKLRKRDTQDQGIAAGVWAGALGLSEEVPFVRETMEVTKAFNPHERGQFFGELGRSVFIPQAVQWIAQHTDKDAQGNLIARKPRTAIERLKVGIPGLREQVKKNPVQPKP